MGPLPTSSQGNKYILVVTDLCTKWVEVFPLKDTTIITLATIPLNVTWCVAMVYPQAFTVTKELICAAVSSTLFARCWELQIPECLLQGNGQVE